MDNFKKINDLLEDFTDSLDNKFIRTPKQWFRKIVKIIQWIPVLWRDYDFDHSYIFELLRYKLVRMEKLFRSDRAWGKKAFEQADKIRVAICLLDRICDNKYTSNAIMFHERKWGESEMITEKVDGGYRLVNFVYPKAKNEEEQKQADKEISRLYKHSNYMEKQDIEYLFKYLNKHIRGFWD